MTRFTVIVNKDGGAASRLGDALVPDLERSFAQADAQVEVTAVAGNDLAEAIEAATGSGRVIVAGGDGSAATAAQILSGGSAELGLLPLGTLNHLARDLGIPTDLAQAAAVAAHGHAAPIDVADVNGRVFVNNASIGLYPLMVRKRDALRRAKGWPKWLSTVPAAWAALDRLPDYHLRLDWGQGERSIVTPLLFVGNNAYSLDSGEIGSRKSLSAGKLAIYAVARRPRVALIWFALRALAGQAKRDLDFETLAECESLTVTSSDGSLEIALDGELRRFDSPLEFRVRPQALTVLIPATAEAG